MIKRNIIFVIVGLLCWSCNDGFLELTPTTKIGDNEAFWENESSLATYSNSFYNYIERGDFTRDFDSDNAEHRVNPPAIRRQVYTMPTALGSGGWNWTQLRNINYFIEKTENANIDPALKNEYVALGRFFRAWFYFKKVKAFGDVPLYSGVLSTDSEDLYKGRDSRVQVMDFVLEDLNFAIANLKAEKYKNRISKWTALALKSRIALYEGTWRKYHDEFNLPGSEQWLRESASASKELIDAGVYALFSRGTPEEDYFELFQPKDTYTEEVILARSSDTQTFYYTPLFTSTSNGNYGATYDLVASYLMRDGRTFQERYPNEDVRHEMEYKQEFEDRDPRLAQTLVYPGYIRVGTTEEALTDFNQNSTGYMIHKHVGPPIEDQGGGYRDVVIIRYAEVLLNYAEAKAELGELTQADLDITVNAIRERAGITAPLLLGAPVDAFQQSLYDNVNDALILEVRRERRIELAFEGFRTNDLKRWKAGHLFRNTRYGIYIKGLEEYIDLDGNGTPDLYVYENTASIPSPQVPGVQYFRMAATHKLSEGSKGRIVPFTGALNPFEDWEYLSPIPTEEITLNPALEQNPNW